VVLEQPGQVAVGEDAGELAVAVDHQDGAASTAGSGGGVDSTVGPGSAVWVVGSASGRVGVESLEFMAVNVRGVTARFGGTASATRADPWYGCGPAKEHFREQLN
jgi:hypothetical protein